MQTANHTLVGTEQVGHLSAYVRAYCRVCYLLRQARTARMRHQCNSNSSDVPWEMVGWGLQEVPFEGPLTLVQYGQLVGILHGLPLHKRTAVTHLLPPFDMNSCHILFLNN